MENNIISYRETGIDKFLGYNNQEKNFYRFKIEGRNQEEHFSITLTSNEIDNLFEQFRFHSEINIIKDNYCFTAINNLIKKNNFLQLSLQLSENQITEEDFEKELDENIGNYLIEMKNLVNSSELKIISNILLSIGKSFSVDEVSELFSVDLKSMNNELLTLYK